MVTFLPFQDFLFTSFSTLVMAYSVEKLLQDAAALVSRLKERGAVADVLISQTGNVHKRMEAMKEVINMQYFFFYISIVYTLAH